MGGKNHSVNSQGSQFWKKNYDEMKTRVIIKFSHLQEGYLKRDIIEEKQKEV